MMKILHLTEHYAPVGGIETYVLELIPLLMELGHKNIVVYRRQHSRMQKGSVVENHYVPVTDKPALDRAKIEAIVIKYQPSVIYLHDVYDPILIDQIARMAPSVGYVHIFYPVCPGLAKLFRRGNIICNRPYGPGCVPNIYMRRCASAKHPRSVYRIMRTAGRYLEAYRNLPSVIVASRYMSELMIQNGIEKNRLEILPYFIRLPNMQTPDTLSSDSQDILFAGRLEHEKGLPYLLKALRLIPTQYNLLVIGDGSLKNEYIELAKKLGVAERVRFTGWLSTEKLYTAYHHCKVAVMPTIMPEPYGKVGVEAMANGRPVVAFGVGGIPDWLTDGFNGFLVGPRDVQQLAVKISRLLSEPEVATEMGLNGRGFVEENLNQDQHVDRLIGIFERLVAMSNNYMEVK